MIGLNPQGFSHRFEGKPCFKGSLIPLFVLDTEWMQETCYKCTKTVLAW